MTNRLEHTYALLIGMDRLGDEAFSHLNTTGEANAQALHSILVGEDRCAYKLKNVISILGEEATRQNIINGFSELENRLRADSYAEKTALIYFSGFEIKSSENTVPTYLIPHDVISDLGGLFRSALNINMLSGMIQSLSPSNLLFISDSENIIFSDEGIIERPIPDPPPPPEEEDTPDAGSKPIPDPPPPPEEEDTPDAGSKPIPDPPPPPEEEDTPDAGSKPIPDPPPPPEEEDTPDAGSKPIPNPAASLGQTLLFSTTGDENSLVMHPHGISTFTWHLMEALSGYSDFARDGRKVVTAHEVWNYIREKVPATAAQMVPPQTQTPVSLSNGIDFAVGKLLGGNGLVGNQSVQPLFGQGGNGQGSRATTSPFENTATLNPNGNVYALLVGVNRYDYFVDKLGDLNLGGCVRDSEEVERFLKESIVNPEERLFIRKLRSLRATDRHGEVATDIICAEDPAPQLATRENIIAAFREFLTRATAEDTVFIHYSGHGSFEFRPAELHHIGRADNVMEKGGVLVAQDSFVDRSGQRIHAISDLELRWLINQVAQSGAHVISAMDCCYSGGNTRNVPDGVTRIKFSEPPQEVNENARPLSSYVFHQIDEEARNRLDSDTPTDFQMPLALKAVSLQACRDNELAKEANFLEGRFGVFTYFLLQVLNATGGNISYRDLIKLVRTKVKGKAGVSFQSPQIDATDVEDTNLSFLSAEPVLNANHYAVSPINATEAWMDAGTLHGLATLSTGETHVDIYLHDENIEAADPDNALKGTLTQIQAHLSKIKLGDGATFEDLDNLYKAVITSSPIPATRIRFVAELEGNEIALADLSNNGIGADLATAITQVRDFIPADGADFRFIGEAGPDEGFQFVVKVSQNGGRQEYSITRRDDSVQLNPPLVGFNANNAETLVAQLVHMARWEKTLKLENEHPHIISPDDVEIEIIDAGAWSVSDVIAFEDAVEVAPAEAERVLSATNGEVELPFRRGDDGKWLAPRIRARIRMKNENRFYYGAFMLISSDFALFTRDYLPDNAMIGERVTEEDGNTNTNGKMLWEVSPGHFDDITGEFVLREEDPGQPMDFYLTEEQIENGITEIEDHFKLIISTAEFDSRYLEQASITEATGNRAPHNVTPTSQLEEFLREAGRETRAGRRRSNGTNGQKGSDWLSVSLTIRTKLIE